jgi:hypothetical protein
MRLPNGTRARVKALDPAPRRIWARWVSEGRVARWNCDQLDRALELLDLKQAWDVADDALRVQLDRMMLTKRRSLGLLTHVMT